MKEEEIYKWLIKHCGPVIRYRTVTELLPSSESFDLEQLTDELLQSQQVKTWLSNLITPSWLIRPLNTLKDRLMAINEIHGIKPTTFENAMGKLTDFGLRKGIPEFDQRTKPYREWLENNIDNHGTIISFMQSMVANFLAYAGYLDEPAVQTIIKKRLDTVYEFARKENYDIYVEPDSYPKMPANFRNKPLINPELTQNEDNCLPLIYDIIGWIAYISKSGTREDINKADAVIKYIFNEEYQRLPWGYGIIFTSGRYYAKGWSVHLPNFKGNSESIRINASVIQMLNWLVIFRAAGKHEWFRERVDELEKYKTEKGTYLLPRSELEEKPAGMWITGSHMGLEEKRRSKLSLELESTFRMALLRKKLANNYL